MNENYPEGERCVVIVVLDPADIIPLGESTQDPGTHGSLGRNDEVGMAEEDLGEGGAVVKACVQEKPIALLEALDELENEFMFRSACLGVEEAQRDTADEVKQAAKLDTNRPQSLLTVVSTETLPKGLRFGQGEGGLIPGNGAQSMPTVKVIFAGGLQP